MHQDDQNDEYDDDQYDYDHPSLNPYYYKFDVGPDHPISKWINDIINNIMEPGKDFNLTSEMLNNISGFPLKTFPVNSWNPNTDKGNSLQYLGSNYQNSPIWKKKYFVVDKINNEYKLHLQVYASYFLKQPKYYKGLFDILN